MYAIYTTEMIEGRKRRMPWRMVLEIVRRWRGLVFSGDGARATTEVDGVPVEYVDKPFSSQTAEAFVRRMRRLGVSRLYYPIGPGRAYGPLQKSCDGTGIELVWYMSSSWNGVGRVLRAWRWLGLATIKPYLIQAIIPKRNWIRRLNSSRVRPLIVMTEFTREMMIRNGYPAQSVHAILPGLDPFQELPGEHKETEATQKVPYFLFFGPPQAIRGLYLIIEVVRRLAKKRRDFKFIPLIRGDENAQQALIAAKDELTKSDLCGIVEPHFERLSTEAVDGYLQRCCAVLKPFVLVQSEVPLAVMEAMQRRKLVIGFEGDGTGELIGIFGKAVSHCNVQDLTRAMEDVLDNRQTEFRDVKFCTWDAVARQWEITNV